MEGQELTWLQITNSKIFRDGARLAMWISPIILSGALWLINDIRTNTVDAVAIIKADVSSVQEVQGSRAADNDRFQAAITGDVLEVKEGVALVQTDVNSVKLDIALMRGVLQEMQRRSLAQANSSQWVPLGSAPAPPH